MKLRFMFEYTSSLTRCNEKVNILHKRFAYSDILTPKGIKTHARAMPSVENLKSRFYADLGFRFRFIAVALAAFLAVCALLLALSLITALFNIGSFPAALGLFFARSFGILSLLIPVYLAYAALILADPRWNPGRIFILSACIFPFMTLVGGFVLTRDFEFQVQQHAFLNFTGKTGFQLIMIFITVLEVLCIRILKNKFFKINERINNRIDNRSLFLLPPPKPAAKTVQKVEPVLPQPHEETIIDIDDDDESVDAEEAISKKKTPQDKTGITRAIEEAEAAAAIQSEQARKKAVHSGGSRFKKYKVPVDILNEYPDGEYWIIDQATRDAAVALKETLEEFRIQAEVTGIRKGPVITMFEILPAPGVKLSRIVGLQDNIALRLAASSVRIVAPIPGKHAVGIEVPNAKRNIVSFKEIIEGELEREGKRMEIPVVMGKDITGEAQTVDLVQMPHLLIAGATGSGKSVCVNSMILSILYQLHPADCRLILIDPKIVELKLYNDIPHLLTPVITEPKKAFQALQYCIYEMERRYACLDSVGVRDIRNYNKRIKEKNIAQEHMPYIVVVIDEFADLMTTTGKELESTVARLAAMSRAVGIHLVLATQRPSIDVITGLIKANIPSRIAFMVASKTDSRIIIDAVGAEKLLGKGDMLYAGVVDPFPIRMQGAFISEEEVEAVVEHVKSFGEPEYIDDDIFFEEDEDEENHASLFSDGGDPLYEKALEIVMQQGKASASYIQRRLKIGYNRAARLVEEMEYRGVVGPAQGSKPREVLHGVN
ncbi:MAG: DNA translocase FtsK [Treponema sp.]|nr:DNA translocase FtsK [Treponema sp.]